jgi:glyoxylase-like metal-dependent hydrolase (beta-lactamase superfamily II)
MFIPRTLRRLAWPLLTLGVVAATGTGVAAQTPPALTLKVINADAGSFHANAVLVTGKTEAVVVDTGFTRADALRIAAQVLDSGKTLTTILISNADPDYYFGAEVLQSLFPQARVVTTPAVRAVLQAKVAGKVALWGPKLGANAPRQPVVPEALPAPVVTLDGETLEIRGTTGLLAHRPYVWIPSLRAVVGNVAVFHNLHVWTADTRQEAERQAWLAQLDEIEALQPATVVPGHMAAGSPLDTSGIRHTRAWLQRFATEAARAANATQLIETMKAAYPQAGLGIALDIGAKVNKGEMAW